MTWLILTAAMGAAQSTENAAPVSIERIRAGLERPAGLVLTLPEPAVQFRVRIEERSYFRELPPIDFTGGPTPPMFPMIQSLAAPVLAQTDLWAVGTRIVNKINAVRRGHAERAAQIEVQEALREFCATHACQ